MSIRELTSQEVETLFPIRNFSDFSKKQLISSVQTTEILTGNIIFSPEEEETHQIYVLEGKVQLSGTNNQERLIDGGSMEARFPLDNNNPHQATAVALTDVTLLKVKQSELDQFQSQPSSLGSEATEISLDEEDSFLYNQLYFEVTHEMQADKLELPSIPETAIRVRKAIADPNISSNKIAATAQIDPAVTAQLIKVANSPLFRGREKIETLPAAITRLGLKAIGNLITSFTMRMVFNAKTADVRDHMSKLWLHSRDVAGICTVMAKKLKGFDPEKAMLAGLVHDIGAIPVLTHADKHPNLVVNRADLTQTLNKLKPILGKMVMTKWNFTEDFADIAENAENWDLRTDEPANYTDLVIVAQLFSFINTPEQDNYPAPTSVPAYDRLTKRLRDPQDTLNVLETSLEEINSIKNLFN